MRAAAGLAWGDLRERPGRAVALVVVIAMPLLATLLLDGYQRSMDDLESRIESHLVVQLANTIGEVAGSRIDADVAELLEARGVSEAVPEIHEITGERIDRGVLLRGVDVTRYRNVTTFEVIGGQALAPHQPPRTAMVGTRLAERRGVGVGDALAIRGRDFEVVGIFHVGTFADDEAWVPLTAAQEVLGWGTDVSVFVIPDEGVLEPGDVLPNALVVGRRGDSGLLLDEWQPLAALVTTGARALEAGAAVVLAVVLWRVAWLRRQQLGVLRMLGLRGGAASYLVLQGGIIAGAAVVLAVALAVVAAPLLATEATGIPVAADLDPSTVGRTLTISLVVLGAGIVGPAVLFRRRTLVRLLHRH